MSTIRPPTMVVRRASIEQQRAFRAGDAVFEQVRGQGPRVASKTFQETPPRRSRSTT
jgi:hypothetical protein